MLHEISKSTCTLMDDKRTLVTEAAEAGLAPGEWPEFIAVTDDRREGFLFQKVRHDLTPDGDLAGMHYQTKDGHFSLLVIND